MQAHIAFATKIEIGTTDGVHQLNSLALVLLIINLRNEWKPTIITLNLAISASYIATSG